MYSVYILRNPAGVFYKGHTQDLMKRLEEHNAPNGFSRYTKKKGPWTLVYHEEFSTRGEAMKREKFFKSGHGRVFLLQKIGASH